MALCERSPGTAWRQRGSVISVRVGKTGLAWGRGLLDWSSFPGPTKVEGDDKAPAGAFRLSRVFGYAHDPPRTRMPYLPLSASIVAVDDPHSRYYNQLLDQTKISHADWRSAEKMILGDDRYKWGVVVEYNRPPKPWPKTNSLRLFAGLIQRSTRC
jgi:D-alanyl-D-alanine dipeptidase